MQRLLFLISCLLAIWGAQSFAPQKLSVTQAPFRQISSLNTGGEGETKTTTAEDSKRRIVGKKIIVKGDVNSGYVRTCISNEASKFRRLIGTMSPPDENSDTAEIYVEGKSMLVEGFVRWCARGTKVIGLSQKLEVVSVEDETPTGLYDAFYVKTQ